jgi:Family of unknown function (DUF5681)
MKLPSRLSAMPLRDRSSSRRRGLQRNAPATSDIDAEQEYRVGPGRPPREFQFKPGQSGNPKGAKRKTPSMAPDLKALLERALNEEVKLRSGERDQIMTKAAAGISKLVNQFAEGDRHARRDLIALAKTLGVDLTAGQGKAIENALAAAVTVEDEAIIANFLQRHGANPEHRGDDIDVALNQTDSENLINRTAKEKSS